MLLDNPRLERLSTMVETILALAGTMTLAVALVYGYVGLRLAGHGGAATPNRRAMGFFALWWLTTSANQILGSGLYIAYAFGYRDLTLQLAYVLLQRLLLAISLVGLMHYLLYLQTGKDRTIPLAIVYGLYFMSAVYTLTARTPVGIESFGWRTDLVWAGEISPLWDLASLLIVLPPTIGAVAMLRVYRRVEGPTRRFRIAMIGIGFTLWWALAIVAGQRELLEVGWLQALNRVVGLAVAIGILLAYEPLAWMRRRYHLEAFSSQGG